MTAEDIAKGIEYSSGFETLNKVPNQETIIISNKTKTIYGASDTSYAFYESKDTLKSFSFMPNPALTIIQSYAFYKCQFLESIDLSKCTKLKGIGAYAFAYCSSTQALLLPQNGELKTLGENSFRKNAFTSLELPTTLEYISSSFFECSITSVSIKEPSSLINIEWGAFSFTKITSLYFPLSLREVNAGGLESTLLNTITIDPNHSALKIVDNVLYNKKGDVLIYFPSYGRQTFEVPEGVTTIAYSAFSYSKITSITFPQTLKSIGGYVFMSSMITSVVLPPSIKTIGMGSFQDSRIQSAVFEEPSNITEIGSWAFSTSYLTSVTLPSSIEKLGGGVFLNCPPSISIGFAEGSDFYFDKETSLILTKDNKVVTNYIGSDDNARVVIPQDVETVRESCFSNKENIAEIVFQGNKLIKIEDYAFLHCTNLKKINIPTSVTNIGLSAFRSSAITEIHFNEITSINSYCFEGCFALIEITFETLNDIPYYCFNNCPVLSTFSVTNGFSKVGQNSFSGCKKLKQISFTTKLTSIASNAFNGAGLTSIDIPEGASITMIPDFTFKDCTALQSASLPSTINLIGVQAFYNTALSSFVIPLGVQTIDRECFGKCGKLVTFEIQAESFLENINSNAFAGCDSLKKIVCNSDKFVVENNALFDSKRSKLIVYPPKATNTVFCFPQTVTEVLPGAFSCAKNLVVVAIPDDSIKIIGANAFENCTKLKMINIPVCVTTIGDGAFSNCVSISCGQAINTTLELTKLENAGFPKIGLKPCITNVTQCRCNKSGQFNLLRLMFIGFIIN